MSGVRNKEQEPKSRADRRSRRRDQSEVRISLKSVRYQSEEVPVIEAGYSSGRWVRAASVSFSSTYPQISCSVLRSQLSISIGTLIVAMMKCYRCLLRLTDFQFRWKNETPSKCDRAKRNSRLPLPFSSACYFSSPSPPPIFLLLLGQLQVPPRSLKM